jgi:hypothetical protein
MFLVSTAHHQEVRYMYVANGTSKMTLMFELRYLYMFLVSTAHHQEVRYMYVANDTSKMT